MITKKISHIKRLFAVLALEGIVGLVAEAVAPSGAFGVELGPAFTARIHWLVRMSLLVVDLPGNKVIFEPMDNMQPAVFRHCLSSELIQT